MSKKTQPERGTSERDDHQAPDKGDTSGGAWRAVEANEPDEAEAVDDVTPTNEPEEEAGDRE